MPEHGRAAKGMRDDACPPATQTQPRALAMAARAGDCSPLRAAHKTSPLVMRHARGTRRTCALALALCALALRGAEPGGGVAAASGGIPKSGSDGGSVDMSDYKGDDQGGGKYAEIHVAVTRGKIDKVRCPRAARRPPSARVTVAPPHAAARAARKWRGRGPAVRRPLHLAAAALPSIALPGSSCIYP